MPGHHVTISGTGSTQVSHWPPLWAAWGCSDGTDPTRQHSQLQILFQASCPRPLAVLGSSTAVSFPCSEDVLDILHWDHSFYHFYGTI
mmetsp:Transcript_29176/g.52473  ORF Transcript_29176/g.52473 Transcript_29176/m.52473 type:complete len:88 (-) Transcript_29176:267-530(-)